MSAVSLSAAYSQPSFVMEMQEDAEKAAQAEAAAARMADELIRAEEQETCQSAQLQAGSRRKGRKARQKERKQVSRFSEEAGRPLGNWQVP